MVGDFLFYMNYLYVTYIVVRSVYMYANRKMLLLLVEDHVGLAAAIALKEIGKNPLIIEKGNIVNAIYHYPTHQTFFSTSEKLEIGDVPFITESYKPKRNQALVYYREVVKRKELRINSFEKVTKVQKQDRQFTVDYR